MSGVEKSLKNQIGDVQTNVNTLASQATARFESIETSVGVNGTAIAAETTRALGAEASLNSAIQAEITRATNAEAVNAQSISAETSRATNAENALQSSLTSLVSAETTRATNAENALQTSINSVYSNSLSVLHAEYDGIVNQNAYNWSFGSGISSSGHAMGIPIPFPFKVIAICFQGRDSVVNPAVMKLGFALESYGFDKGDSTNNSGFELFQGVEATKAANVRNYHVVVNNTNPETNPPGFLSFKFTSIKYDDVAATSTTDQYAKYRAVVYIQKV